MSGTFAAPAELEKVRAFVNTLNVETGEDRLADPAGLRRWIRASGLSSSHEVTAADLDRAVELRAALRAALLANHGGSPVPDEALDVLNRVAQDARVQLAFTPDRTWTTRVDSTGAHQALGTLVTIILEAMREGTWTRLKVCANDACRWAFYDHSRARTGKWCSMEICGNRAKQKAWRSRH